MADDMMIERYRELSRYFPKWEKIKDLIDQYIDIMLNYRQSGHPGGSRSKVHAFVSLIFGGAFRFDIRHPEKRFGDRFILSAGHTVPLIYATFSVLNHALRIKKEQTGNIKYEIPEGPAGESLAVYPEDLVHLRHRGGLSGHAEMEGKTLFLKWNTGPSGHGLPATVGEALALKRAGADGVKVVAIEGEGGLTPGAGHESKNSAWGLGLDNLFYLIDWNDFGIDDRPASAVMKGTPETWFAPYGWNVYGTDQGSNWESLTRTMLSLFGDQHRATAPSVMWFKTRKGREYLVYDNKSHGAAHPMNSDLFWKTKQVFAEKYGVTFEGFGKEAPSSAEEIQKECLANLEVVSNVLKADQDLVDYIADYLVDLGDSVPKRIPSFRLFTEKNPLDDPSLYDYRSYPEAMYAAPGTKEANRGALAKFGAWINGYCRKNYNRPLFIACSADLAESTNISGFAKNWEDIEGYGWYERTTNPEGVLLPQEITEFTNAGMVASLSSVNFSEKPFDEYNGFFGACSTYGSFSYLKYGEMRLFSQLAQDSEIKVGKVLWIAGHSGPETAEDARTHFGIFSPMVTQLFPAGHVINLYPWEHNEVPVVLGAALKTSAHIIALHLTRPKIEIPDRKTLGMDSHFEAAKGMYIIRPYTQGEKKMGTIIVQGTSTTANIVKILPELDKQGLNVKIVAAISAELFRMQSDEWRNRVLPEHEWMDSTVVSNASRIAMSEWFSNEIAREYAMTADFDNRWRTGGSVDEVIEEAHLSPNWLLKGIARFAADREKRLERFKKLLDV